MHSENRADVPEQEESTLMLPALNGLAGSFRWKRALCAEQIARKRLLLS